MLPDQSICVTLVLDDGCQTVLFDFFGLQPFYHIVYMVANRTDVCSGAIGGIQPDTALGAAKLHSFVLVGHSVDRLTTDRALGICALALIEHHIIAAMGTNTTGQFIRADIDGVAAGAINLLSCKEARFCFSIFSTIGALHNKFSHFSSSLFFYPLSRQFLWV